MNTGSYILILYLPQPTIIKVGSLGGHFFKRGYYCYVGSAMRGLNERINRHLRRGKKLHWHIDYFREKADVVDVVRFISEKKMECGLSKKVLKRADNIPLKKFGSSDCTCESHFYYFTKNPREYLNSFYEGV